MSLFADDKLPYSKRERTTRINSLRSFNQLY